MLVRSQNNRSYWQICARHGFPRPAWSVASVLESETVKVLTHSIMPVLVFRAPHPPFVFRIVVAVLHLR